ncbi:MAG: hypothetical protein EHM12_09785 [Dehalococcoidia bacterium]|nr:MAG: hypothetical protein EHM12_09785 [Dehalococcoidia bacterium]
MIVVKGIDWEEFRGLLDETYKYFIKKKYVCSTALLDKIYNRYQNGERTMQLYKEFMDIVGD